MTTTPATSAPPPTLAPLSTTDLLSIDALTPADLRTLLATALALKQQPELFARHLAGKSVVMLFEKPSLRTRMSFEVGVFRLGGQPIYYDHSAGRIGQRESTSDYAKNLERWVHAIVARTFSQQTLVDLAHHARVPVINALSDNDHPCQALADILTLAERFGSIKGLKVTYIGDGNNVCLSLMQAVCMLSGHMVVITPPSDAPSRATLDHARRMAQQSGGSLTVSTDPAALAGSRAVYTDTWVSMHQETEGDSRVKRFIPYRVTTTLMSMAAPDAVFMHCLPAHRGEEVTAEVIDSPQSVVFDQAENRMHAQNAVLLHLVAAAPARTTTRQPTERQPGAPKAVTRSARTTSAPTTKIHTRNRKPASR